MNRGRVAALGVVGVGLLASMGFLLGLGRSVGRFEYAIVSGAGDSGLHVQFATGDIRDRDVMADFLKLERSFDRKQLGPLTAVEIMTSTGWDLVDFEVLHAGEPPRVSDRVYLLRRGI